MKLNFGTLKNGAYRYRVLLVAVIALVHAGTVRLAFKLGLAIRAAAVRAERAVRPAQAFKVLAGGFGVFEAGLVEYGGSHGVPLFNA